MTIHATEPVAAAQITFRTLLMAMATPGTVHRLAPRAGESPEAAVCFALLDHEVQFAVVAQDGRETGVFVRQIALDTGSIVGEIEDASFILTYGALPAEAWHVVRRGTLAFPDAGATVVYILPAVGEAHTGVPSVMLTLSGPGIETTQMVTLAGLPATEYAAWQHANRDYPMGVDAIFVDNAGRVVCLPRSSTIQQTEEG